MSTYSILSLNLKSVILLFGSIFISQIINAQVVGPEDWSSLRLYGHAFRIHGTPSSEFASQLSSAHIKK